MTTKTKERTPKEFVATMKRSNKEVSQTEVVSALMEKYPDLAPKDIEEVTGIRRGTIYTIQSRLRSAHRKTPAKTAETDHMNEVEDIKEVMTPETAGKHDLFNRLADVYLDKIAQTKDIEEATKYNQLLIQVMDSLD